MLYKCISFVKKKTSATAKDGFANKDYFEGEFINAEDPWDFDIVKYDLFPTTAAQTAMYDQWTAMDTEQIPQIRFDSFTVELPAFQLMDTKTKALRPDVLTRMQVTVRMVKNKNYVPNGAEPEFSPESDPKTVAEGIVKSMGKWVDANGTAVVKDATVTPPAPETAPKPTINEGDETPDGLMVYKGGKWVEKE